MEKIELVELVREKAGVGYADAKEALDANGDDLLDALVWLERQGRSQTRSAYATTGAPAPGGVSSEMRAAQSAYARSSATSARAVAGWFSRVREACARFVRRGMETRVVSRREDGRFVTLPLLPTVVGMGLWLIVMLMSLGRGIYAFDLLSLLVILAARAAPVVCFFYLVFACRIERSGARREEPLGPGPTSQAPAPSAPEGPRPPVPPHPGTAQEPAARPAPDAGAPDEAPDASPEPGVADREGQDPGSGSDADRDSGEGPKDPAVEEASDHD